MEQLVSQVVPLDIPQQGFLVLHALDFQVYDDAFAPGLSEEALELAIVEGQRRGGFPAAVDHGGQRAVPPKRLGDLLAGVRPLTGL